MNQPYYRHMDQAAATISNAAIRKALVGAIELHRTLDDVTKASVANIRDDKDLSPSGKTRKVRDVIGSRAWEVIKAQKIARRLAERIEEKRAELKLPEIEPTDSAGAILRMQVRSGQLAGKTNQELRALIPTMSPLYLQTILEAPQLIGADAHTVDVARTHAIELAYPGMTAKLESDRDAVNLLVNATAAVVNTFGELGELPNKTAIEGFLNERLADQRHIDADVERQITES
ncbi:hypothetical protein BjapCC829_22935 [Bradyrhizobium barranii]|uniref:Uncharacterized protein n=1 Tax=Bradyrhizobium barranii TaxID=2992140 RepID=A0ABY3QAL4_9BRAD|nr:hypothetical protein [Bradyrhizobium japonicum]UFW82848.1 hypothetical protein BjapCC829_22935 [Bradyrhizobium japonicum]